MKIHINPFETRQIGSNIVVLVKEPNMMYVYIFEFTATLVMAVFARADKKNRQMWALLISAGLFLSLYLEKVL